MSGTVSEFGVVPAGFVRKRLPDLISDISAAINALGAVATGDPTFQIDLSPSTASGQEIQVMAEQYATLWEIAEAVWNSAYPVTATGVSLDNAVSFSGVTRLQESQTLVYAVMYGLEGTSVPVNSLATQSSTGLLFNLAATTVITAGACLDVVIGVLTLTASGTYTVIVNSIQYQITATATPTAQAIATQLAQALANSGLTITQPTSTTVEITGSGRTQFSLSVSTNLSINSLGSVGQFIAEDYGANFVDVGELNTVSSTVGGWTSIFNLEASITGQDQETDAELRTRYVTGVFGLGAGTLSAIQANILDRVEGVTNVIVIENATSSANSAGQPANSIQCVVQGGDDLSVAQEIYLQKPAGIATFGTTTQNVTLANGSVYPIEFTRPQLVYIWIMCTTTLLPEETFPGNGDAAIAQALVNFGNTLAVGGDVVVQRFYGPVYAAVSGIASLNITMASSTSSSAAPASSAYSANNIPISPTQLAVFAIVRTSVT